MIDYSVLVRYRLLCINISINHTNVLFQVTQMFSKEDYKAVYKLYIFHFYFYIFNKLTTNN